MQALKYDVSTGVKKSQRSVVNLTVNWLSMSLPVSKLLQTQNIDLIEAIQNADNFENIVKNTRINSERKFKITFNNNKSKFDTLSTEIPIARNEY